MLNPEDAFPMQRDRLSDHSGPGMPDLRVERPQTKKDEDEPNTERRRNEGGTKAATPPSRHPLFRGAPCPWCPSNPYLVESFLAGQQTEWIRLRLEGNHKGLDFVLGDGIGIDDFEVNTSGEQHADYT